MTKDKEGKGRSIAKFSMRYTRKTNKESVTEDATNCTEVITWVNTKNKDNAEEGNAEPLTIKLTISGEEVDVQEFCETFPYDETFKLHMVNNATRIDK